LSFGISELGSNCHTPISRYSLYKSTGPIVKQIQYSETKTNILSNIDLAQKQNSPKQNSPEATNTNRDLVQNIELKKLRALLRRYKTINERCLLENENLVKQINEGRKKEMLLQQEVVSLYGELEACNTNWLPIAPQQVTETTIKAIEVYDFDMPTPTQIELQTQLQTQDHTLLQLHNVPPCDSSEVVPWNDDINLKYLHQIGEDILDNNDDSNLKYLQQFSEDVLDKNDDSNLKYLQQIQQLQDENANFREQIDQMKKEEYINENYVSKEMYQKLLQQYNDISVQNEQLQKTILDLKKQREMDKNLTNYSKEKLEARMIQLYAELKKRTSSSTNTRQK